MDICVKFMSCESKLDVHFNFNSMSFIISNTSCIDGQLLASRLHNLQQNSPNGAGKCAVFGI